MEYEKHIKRLVLGYLKNECKNAYKVFLKYNWQNHNKHIPTRVAGQTLEDILRVYSHIQEIVLGRLEETDYYKERSVEFSSPIHLDDQLLYLLDKDRPFTPASTPCPRSPAESSIAETRHENHIRTTHFSDVETTPEHTLPGNVSSNDENYHSRTPFKRKSGSPVFTTPCIEKLPPSDKEIISEVMTQKLLEKPEFHKKIAENINSALNTPEISSCPQSRDNDKNKDGVGLELEEMIKNALKRTEADPMFEDLLQGFKGTPIENTIGKAVCADIVSTSSSNNGTNVTTPSEAWHHIDDHNNRAVSSILSAANAPASKPDKFTTATNDNVTYDDNTNNFEEVIVPPSTQIAPAPASAPAPAQASFPSNQYLLPTSGGMYMVPQPTTTTIQSATQQQQFYIVNQQVMIPQTNQMMQLLQPIQPAIQPAIQPVVIQPKQKTAPAKESTRLTEQEIMSMPTIILNERNEITYADPGSFGGSTPSKLNEAHNIKEYLTLYGATDQSPILKLNPQKSVKKSKPPVKSQPPIKPTPTIKVEIYQRDTPLLNVVTNTAQTNATCSSNNPDVVPSETSTANVDKCTTGLPNLNETEPVSNTNQDPAASVINTAVDEPASDSNAKTKPVVASAICTPSPLKTIVRKPTPKSGSHVRNLTFPSPLRRTSEKPEATRNSPRILNKQQAAKDLFKSTKEDGNKSNVKADKGKKSVKTSKSVPEKKAKHSKKESSKSPKQDVKKTPKQTGKNDVTKDASKDIDEEYLPKYCWDSNLRKMVPPIIEETISTPIRRTSARRRAKRQSTDLDVSDADGKKLEEALKTPDKKEKPKRKTPSRKKVKILSDLKLEPKLKSEDVEIKGQTKILSPSKLNANKRNILPNDIDDITPDTSKETSQYPVSSKTRRNINSLLETPLKDDLVPPTPGKITDTSDTPFTPMLKANLKDFTGGDIFSVNTPNFPVTPGLATMVNTSAAYYILNDNENNKATEAIVLSEERKSSTRKSDEEDIVLSPRVYGSKEILDSFNKNCAGKKNLELLDNRGVQWEGNSDKDDKSENNSDDESNNTVIQNRKVEQPKQIKDASKKSKVPGKCMDMLQSQLLKDADDCSKEDISMNLPNDTEDKDGEQASKAKSNADEVIKSSSGSDSEVLSKKSYDKKRNDKNENPSKQSLSNGGPELEKICKMEDDVPGNNLPNDDERINAEVEESIRKIAERKCTVSTEEVIRQTITDVCLKETSGLKSATSDSLIAELEEKKKRMIELEKSQPPSGGRKGRRTVLKPQPNLNPARSKRKSTSPKKMVKSLESNEEEGLKDESDEKEKAEPVAKPNKRSKKASISNQGGEIGTESQIVDSQDEFFKKSGTNLHRKNKGIVSQKSTETSRDSADNVNEETKTRSNPSLDAIQPEEKHLNNNRQETDILLKENQQEEHTPVVEENSDQSAAPQKEDGNGLFSSLNSPDVFEKSWNCCDFRRFESETVVLRYDESKASDRQLKDYNFELLKKKILVALPVAEGATVDITLACTPFDTLLGIDPSHECETTDASKDEVDSSVEHSKRVPDVSDSENAGYKTDDADDVKCAKKRKHRSDSCNSNSSAKRMKPYVFLNENNIEKLLTKIHGPS